MNKRTEKVMSKNDPNLISTPEAFKKHILDLFGTYMDFAGENHIIGFMASACYRLSEKILVHQNIFQFVGKEPKKAGKVRSK